MLTKMAREKEEKRLARAREQIEEMSARNPYTCAYWESSDYNHGGHLPCNACKVCTKQLAFKTRLLKYNEYITGMIPPKGVLW